MQGVRRDVRVGDEDGKLGEEDGQRGERVLEVEEGREVHLCAGDLVVREALLDEEARDEGGGCADEADGADGPCEAHVGFAVEDDEREDDAADAAGRADDSGGEGTALAEPLAGGGDAGVEEEGGGEAAEDGEC